jgi:hypothetical protein
MAEPAVPASIWAVPAYLPYVQPPLTESARQQIEEHLGHRLPAEYFDVLREQNGGYLRMGLPGHVHDVLSGIGPQYPSLYRPDWSEAQDEVSFPLEGLIPFDGDGHWHLCFDYRGHAEIPSITHIDLENDTQTLVAPSFAAYLQLLVVPTEEGQFTLPAPEGLEGLVARLSTVLQLEFENLGSDDLGYPVFRAAVGRGRQPEWIWVSPNQIPKAFVRADDDEFDALKDRCTGTALRYPELTDTACLLEVTDGAAPLLQSLTDPAWGLTPLARAIQAER